METEAPERTEQPPVPLLRQRRYLLWLAGDSAQELGVGLGSFAMPLIAVALTGDAATAGTIAGVQGVGAVVGLLPGGVLADRHDRRLLRAWSAVIGLALSLLLIGLLLGGLLTPVLLALIGFAMQLRSSVLRPASEALLRTIVAKRQVATAVAANQGRDAAITIGVGPLGGVLFSIGPAVPFVGEAIAWLVLLATNATLGGDHRPVREDATPSSVRAELVEGLRFCWSARLLRHGCVAFMLVNLAFNGVIMTLILWLTLTGHSPVVIGRLSLVVGIGALIGALAAGVLISRVPTGTLIALALGSAAAALGVIATSPDRLPVVLTALGLAMLVIPSLNAALAGVIIHVVPNQILGRVESVISFLAIALMPFAPALAGWGIELVGVRTTIALFAVVAALGLLVVLVSRPLRSLPRSADWDRVSLDAS